MLSISVVVPTLKAAKTLARTLSALQNNTVKPGEILVIDGLSQDGTSEIARQFGCEVIPNTALHTAAARQIGLVSARSQIVAMIDADCVPCQDWLERIRDHFIRDPKLDGVGGPVWLKHAHTRVEAYCARKSRVGIPEQAELITRKGMRGRFAGSNCAYRSSVIRDIGGYDLSFKTHGSDIDLFWRAVDNNLRLLFDPALMVEHLGFSKDLTTLARKSFGYGIGSARLAHSHFSKRQFDLRFYWRPWIEAVQESLRQDQKKYPECVFIDDFMFALGRTWGLIHGDRISRL